LVLQQVTVLSIVPSALASLGISSVPIQARLPTPLPVEPELIQNRFLH